MHTFVFKVDMTCSSCETAVKKVLQKNIDKGIVAYDVDLDSKTVIIRGSVSEEEAKSILEKTGKKVEMINDVDFS
ncbi:copper transport protein ATOX1-like [Cimex lectularius]|uniref:Copper transport protein ATOX1 n=1 Tax=Cimex lectularius TaxID=79782 RepID=A0A8I6TCW7_CIMLE|nr:copper transport protein ATOX1-like [Cimex lectularius]